MNNPIDKRSVVLNGTLVPAADAMISPLGDGFMYGLGLFETIKVLGGRPVFFQEHVERLHAGMRELGLAPIPSVEELRARCRRCIAANDLGDAALKIVVFQDTVGAGELILPRTMSYPATRYDRGFYLQTVPDGRCDNRLFALKTLNYLKSIAARRAAEAAGFNEALFVESGGAILEGAISNVFIVKNGVVQTPPLAQGILPGIARAAVLRRREDVREAAISTAQLFAADEVFVTNSLLGVMPVARVDAHTYDVHANPVTRASAETYRASELRSAAEEPPALVLP